MRAGLLALLAPAVAAADPKEVDLLQAAPATVAVSSTVDNAAIVPAHLVDGKLDTAWNSRAGDLVHAWIAFRVPGAAHVARIRLTAGFTQGDLFTQNYRIKRIAVARDGKPLGTFVLDPDRRDLQDIAVDAAGGDFRLEIVEVVPGTKPAWREIAVSELAVMGTIAQPHASTPAVLVGGLDSGCDKALTASDEQLDTDEVQLSPSLFACKLRHGAHGSDDSKVEVAVVKVGTAKPIARLPSIAVTNHEGQELSPSSHAAVAIEPFALGLETALVVTQTSDWWHPMGAASSGGTMTLYRFTAGKLTAVLDASWTASDGEVSAGERCQLAPGAARKPLPDVDVACTSHTDHYRWTGSKYERK